MADLAPKLSSGLSVRQPITDPLPAGYSLASAGLGLFGALADRKDALDEANAPTKPTSKELEQSALLPFARQIEDLKNSDIDDAQFTNQSRKLLRTFITRNPEYATEARQIAEGTYGVTTEPLEEGIGDIVVQQQNEFFTNPANASYAIQAIAYNDDNTVDYETTRSNMSVIFAERSAQEARLAQTNQRLEQVKADKELYTLERQKAAEGFLPTWTQSSRKFRDDLIRSASAGVADFDSPEEIMTGLNEIITMTRDQYRADASAAGLLPEDYETRIDQALKPLTDLQTMVDENIAEPAKVLEAFNAASELQAQELLIDVFGIAAGNREMREAVSAAFANQLYKSEDFGSYLKKLKEANEKGGASLNVFSPAMMGMSGPDIVRGNADGGAPVITPEAVDEKRTKLDEDGTYLEETIKGAAAIVNSFDPTNQGGVKVLADTMADSVAVFEALNQPLSPDALKAIFNPSATDRLATVVQGTGTSNIDVKRSLWHLASKQYIRNKSLLDTKIAALAQEGVQVVKTTTGLLQLRGPDGGPVSGPRELLDGANKAINNMNLINTRMSRIDPEWTQKVRPTATQEGTVNKAEQDERSIQDYLTDVATTSVFENPESPVVQLPQAVREDTEFLNAVSGLASEINTDPSHILRIIAFETGGTFDPAQKNAAGSGAVGLIQFMPFIAKEFGVTSGQLASMSRVEQMKYVSSYFKSRLKGVENPTLSDLYMAVLWPAAVGKPDSTPILDGSRGQYTQNRGLDTNNDGVITKGEATARAFAQTGTFNIPMSGTPSFNLSAEQSAQNVNEGTRSSNPDIAAFVEGQSPPVQGATGSFESVPTQVPSTPAQGGSQEGSGGGRTASAVATRKLEQRVLDILRVNNLDPEQVPRFTTPEEVQAAVESDAIAVGSVVLVNGEPFLVREENE